MQLPGQTDDLFTHQLPSLYVHVTLICMRSRAAAVASMLPLHVLVRLHALVYNTFTTFSKMQSRQIFMLTLHCWTMCSQESVQQ